jgi:hypothetical protein
MDESSSKDDYVTKKWACSYCTFLNWDASIKCVLCYQPKNKPMFIEELCPANESSVKTSIIQDELQQLRWPCPTCTYLNCQRTKRCIQCTTDRPSRYATPTFVNNSMIHVKQATAHNQQHKDNHLISRALNKWTCQTCTFDNWPKASKCTLCGQKRLISRVQSISPPHESDVQNLHLHRKRNSGENQHQDVERTDSRGDLELELFNQLTIGNPPRPGNRPEHNKDRHGSKRNEQ